jgi:hypothetical protein
MKKMVSYARRGCFPKDYWVIGEGKSKFPPYQKRLHLQRVNDPDIKFWIDESATMPPTISGTMLLKETSQAVSQ